MIWATAPVPPTGFRRRRQHSRLALSPDRPDPDACVIKTILALVNDPERREGPYRIAAEIKHAANAELARIVGGNEVQVVLADELVSRIMVQSTRQPSLSSIYSELLDFEGCEIYTAPQPALTGKTYDEALLAYENCALIGLCEPGGRVRLNPDGATVFEKGAQAILIAEDRAAVKTAKLARGAVNQEQMHTPTPPEKKPERCLILGWNRRAPMVALVR